MLLPAIVDRAWQSSVGSLVRAGVVGRGIGYCICILEAILCTG
jgi:hypothetical protein